MQAGKLNRRISILQPAGQDELGQPLNSWGELGKAWANIRALRGVEVLKAGADTSRVTASIRLRYREDITAAMRVAHGATVYDVKAVLPDTEGRRHVDLVCEVVP